MESQTQANNDHSVFLLRARLTPLLAKSNEDAEHIRHAFVETFDEHYIETAAPPSQAKGERVRYAMAAALKDEASHYFYPVLGSTLALLAILAILVYFQRDWASQHQTTIGAPIPTGPPGPTGPSPARSLPATRQQVSGEQIALIAKQLIEAAGSSRIVSIGELAAKLSSPDPSGVKSRATISIMERYLSRPPDEKFTLTQIEFEELIKALAAKEYPARSISSNDINAAITSSKSR